MEFLFWYAIGIVVTALIQLTLVLPTVISNLALVARQTDDLILLDYAHNWSMHIFGVILSSVFLWWFQALSLMTGVGGHTERLTRSLHEVYTTEQEKSK